MTLAGAMLPSRRVCGSRVEEDEEKLGKGCANRVEAVWRRLRTVDAAVDGLWRIARRVWISRA
jgi:hypothetical protein